MLTRTEDSINLLNVKTKKSYKLYEDKKPLFDNEYLKIITTEGLKSKTILLYSTPSSDGQSDDIRRVNLSNKFINGLKHFGRRLPP